MHERGEIILGELRILYSADIHQDSAGEEVRSVDVLRLTSPASSDASRVAYFALKESLTLLGMSWADLVFHYRANHR
jgi:hypothetical protein